MKTIKFYKYNGDLEDELPLTNENIAKTNGMLLKCHLSDKNNIIGYGDPYRTHDKNSYDGEVHDYIYLWTWDNLDENTHQLVGDADNKYNQTFITINIESLLSIDAMVYSNPRWGGKLTNRFEFHKVEENQSVEIDIPPFLKKAVITMKNNFEFKNDKYDINGFNLSKNVEYDFEYIIGDKNKLSWGFNINGKLIGVSSCGNYSLDSYSALVIDNEFYILSDFDLFKINLDTLDCNLKLSLDDYAPMDEIYKFFNGVILIGENNIIYFENNKIIWTYNSKTYIQSATVFKDNTVEVIEDEPYSKFILDKDGNKI